MSNIKEDLDMEDIDLNIIYPEEEDIQQTNPMRPSNTSSNIRITRSQTKRKAPENWDIFQLPSGKEQRILKNQKFSNKFQPLTGFTTPNQSSQQDTANNQPRSQSPPLSNSRNMSYNKQQAMQDLAAVVDMTNAEVPNTQPTPQSGGIPWRPSKSAWNKAFMNNLKQKLPDYRKTLLYRAQDRKNFPPPRFAPAYYERGTADNIERWGHSYGQVKALADQGDQTAMRQLARRQKHGYRGYGAYTSNAGFAGRGALWGKMLGGMGGRALGGRFGLGSAGAAIGSKLGDWASDKVEGFFGRGGYENAHIMSSGTEGNSNSTHNSLINHSQGTISMHSGDDETNSIHITHSEFIGDIKPSSSNFETQYFLALNPGLPQSFPWLSNIAQFYEEYEFVQLMFTIKSMVTEGNSSAAGTVVIATQYNPMNAPFSTKQTMENYDYANSGKVTENLHHGIECDPRKRGGNQIEYIRTGSIPANQDLKTYDHAVFQVSTNGALPSLVIGELWVHYKVVLRKTKIPNFGQISRNNNATIALSGTNSTAAVILGGNLNDVISAQSTSISSQYSLYCSTSNVPILGSLTGTNTYGLYNNVITLPQQCVSGVYVVILQFTGVTTQPTTQASIDASSVGVYSSSILSQTTIDSTPATDAHITVFQVNFANSTNSPSTIKFSGLTSIVSTAWKVNIFQVYSAV